MVPESRLTWKIEVTGCIIGTQNGASGISNHTFNHKCSACCSSKQHSATSK